MGYIVLKVYSFECDDPSCSHLFECTPANIAPATGSLLDEAHRQLRSEGWTANRNYAPGAGWSQWLHFCPKHLKEGS